MLQRVRPSKGHNVTDDSRLSALETCTASYRLVEEAADALKAAKKEFSADLKRAAALGHDTSALRRAIKDRFVEEQETTEAVHEYIRFRALQGMPRIQQDLMALWAPIDLPAERKAEVERNRWREDGAFSARQGHGRDINPHPVASEAHQAWDSGWLEDQQRIAYAMGRGEQPAPAPA